MNLADLLGFFSAAWLTYGAGAIGAAGGVALVYSLLPLAPYRGLVQVLGAGGIAFSCFLAGIGAERQAGEANALRAENGELRAVLAFKEGLAEQERIRAEEERQLRITIQDKVEDYERDLKARPGPCVCAVGDRARRLCDIAGARCRE